MAIDLNDQQQRNLAFTGITNSIDDLDVTIRGLDDLDSFKIANELVIAIDDLPDDQLLIPLGTDKAELTAVLAAQDNIRALVGTIDPTDLATIHTFRQKAGILVAFPVR